MLTKKFFLPKIHPPVLYIKSIVNFFRSGAVRLLNTPAKNGGEFFFEKKEKKFLTNSTQSVIMFLFPMRERKTTKKLFQKKLKKFLTKKNIYGIL